MRNLLVLVLLASLAGVAHAGTPTPEQLSETTDAPKDRRALSLGMLGGLYAGFTTWAYFAWYHDVDHLPAFEVGGDGFLGDDTYAGGADKFGHFTANYAATRASTRLLRWGGWKPLPASVMSATLAALYFTFIEIKDGYYYEMSPGDLAADVAGAVFGAIMENTPTLDRYVDFRLEYFPSPQYRAIVAGRATGEINNLNIAEDYNGQTYMLAFHLGELPALGRGRYTGWTRYVDTVVGFRSRGYRPEPAPEEFMNREQDLYLGLSLNAQGVWDRLFRDSSHTTVRAVGHDTLEIMNLPYTSVPVLEASRGPEM